MSTLLRDFADEIQIPIDDIKAFAQKGIELPKDFVGLYLKKDKSIQPRWAKTSIEAEKVQYNLYMQETNDKINIGEFQLSKSDTLEFGDKKVNDCWERIVEMHQSPKDGISYGRHGFTRAAIKALMEETKNIGIKDVCAFVVKNNEASLKLGQAVGWGQSTENYIKDGHQSSGDDLLFHSSTADLVEKLNAQVTKWKEENCAPTPIRPDPLNTNKEIAAISAHRDISSTHPVATKPELPTKSMGEKPVSPSLPIKKDNTR